jgi:hypothetical protein
MRNLVIAFIVVVLASTGVTLHESAQSDRRQTKADVQACLRTTERAALDAAFQYDAAQARAKDGNKATADKYTAVANQIIISLPGPGSLADKKQMAELDFFVKDGVLHAELTPEARKMQLAACDAAF